jgi:5-methyltetrahydrofolate--homocysteine methyltransferase
MLDLQEARAALLAVKESCALPVCVSLTFNEEQRTLTGSGPLEALLTLQSMGADAVGCNCSTGPETMLQIIAAMKPYAKVPLLAKPNAGLPKLVNGRTEFDMQAAEFASYAKPLVAAGVNLIGGCRGSRRSGPGSGQCPTLYGGYGNSSNRIFRFRASGSDCGGKN